LIAGLSIEMRPEKAYIYHALEFMVLVAFQTFQDPFLFKFPL